MSGIGRRVKKAFLELQGGDFESAAAAAFQAVDATGRKRFPKKRNGARFMGLLADQQDIITAAAFNGVFTDFEFNNYTLPKALWKFARNPLLHEAELDQRIRFDNESGLQIGKVWNLPPTMLVGICLGVVAAKENAGEVEFVPGRIRFWGRDLEMQDLWGGEEYLRAILPKR